MGKILVAYFSATGRTKRKAEKIASCLQADLYEIKPAVSYSKADLNWLNKKSRTSIEMSNKAFRPELSDKNSEIAGYDTILLGFPIWWYVAPTIINSFLESYDFTGKKIVLFATSGSSGFGNTLNELKLSAPNADFVEGKICNGLLTEKMIKDLIKGV